MGLALLLLLAFQQDLLGHESPEIRDRATRDLLASGESVRLPLEQQLRETADAEVRSRIREILRRLDLAKRRKDFKGGRIVDDLGVTVTLTHEKESKTLSLSIEVCNLGPAEKTIRELRGWNCQFPDGNRQSSGSAGAIRVRQLTGERGNTGYGAYGCGGRPTFTPVPLQPGETYRKSQTIDISELRPGEHEVDVALLARVHGTSEDVVSNALRFTVEK